MKSRQNGNRQRNNEIKSKQISFEVTRAWGCFTTWERLLKCVLITNIITEHYMEDVIRYQKVKQAENEKKNTLKDCIE